MQELLIRAREEQDLFWLSMGFESSDGEKDEDFNSKDDDREGSCISSVAGEEAESPRKDAEEE
jgi:hypothetical protein